MKKAHIEIYLSENSELCIDKVDPSGQRLPMVSESLEVLEATDIEDVIAKVGHTVIGALSVLHKGTFTKWGAFKKHGKIDGHNEKYLLALELISDAVSNNTAIHNSSIEFLLRQASKNDEEARSFLKESWPAVRSRLGEFTTKGFDSD